MSTLGGRWPPRVRCVHLGGRLLHLLDDERRSGSTSVGDCYAAGAVCPPQWAIAAPLDDERRSVSTSVGDCYAVFIHLLMKGKEANEE